MLDFTSRMAWSNVATGRFRVARAAPNASSTLPSSRTVVPAMSRQATVIRVIGKSPPRWRSAGHAATARSGDQHDARLGLGSVIKRGADTDFTVDPSPAALDPRDGGAEQRLGAALQVVVGVGV